MDCSVTVLHCVVYIEEEKRMKLYFGNMVTTVTTLMIVSLVGFVGYSISNRSNISFWGRRSLFVLAYGLVICCFAAARDGLDKTIQYTIDGSCNPGIFSLVSVPNMEDNFDENDKDIIKALEKRGYDSCMNKRMVIILSDTGRTDIENVRSVICRN